MKGFLKNGLILTPSNDFKINCYPDTDFAGLWLQDDKQDPHCVRSRTRYVICLANCPVLWKSKLQTEIAHSTMEAEYVALSTSCHDLFTLIDITNEICSIVHVGLIFHKGLTYTSKYTKTTLAHLLWGELEPRQATTHTNHHTIKFHWFQDHLGPRKIHLVKISSEERLGDLFTKGLIGTKFSRLQKKLMGC